MRFLATACLVLLLFSAAGHAQQAAPATKPWTAEQLALQRRYAAYETQRLHLRAEAEYAFCAEMALEKAGDCAGAQSTADFNTCFGKAAETADRHLRTYEGALGTLLALQMPDTPAGDGEMVQTAAEDAAEFSRLEAAWRAFLALATAAAFHQFDGGTGGPSAELEIQLGLVRDHLRQLNKMYAMTLTL